jgi:hypothetical protein
MAGQTGGFSVVLKTSSSHIEQQLAGQTIEAISCRPLRRT